MDKPLHEVKKFELNTALLSFIKKSIWTQITLYVFSKRGNFAILRFLVIYVKFNDTMIVES